MYKILLSTITDLFTRAEVYSEPSRNFKLELFCESSSESHYYFHKKSSILHVRLGFAYATEEFH